MDRIQRIREFYNKNFEISKKYCSTKDLEHVSVGWNSEKSAQANYKTITSYKFQDWTKIKNVLDVGSGLGNFLAFLQKEKNFSGSYTGIEILEKFVLSSKKRFDNANNSNFIHADFLTHNFENTIFDWSFSIGSLSIVQQNQEKEDILTIKKMAEISKYGFSIFLNDKTKFKPNNISKLIPPGNLIAEHNIDNFVKMIKSDVKNIKNIKIKPLKNNGLKTPKTFIHVSLS